MRVLVTGAAGFIGSHLCESLLRAGHDTVGVDVFTDYYPRKLKEANLEDAKRHPGFRFHELDLRAADLAAALEGVEVVIHAAARPGLDGGWAAFGDYVGCNLMATERLLAASLVASVSRFVLVSTSSVYGSDARGDEQRPTAPISAYGVTKLAAEHLAAAFGRATGLPVVTLRYFSIYGPRQRPDMAFHRFIEQMRQGRPITVYGNGEQSRSNTFIDDCVRGTVLAIERGVPGEIYNIGGGEIVTLRSAITILGEELAIEPVLRHEPDRPGDQRHTAADIGKARATLGFEPIVPVVEGLRRQVRWHLATF